MDTKENIFDSFVTQSILKTNIHGIVEVIDLESLKSMCFDGEQYRGIKNLIQSNNLSQVLTMPAVIEKGCEEFLEIMKFVDQNKDRFIVTIYDSTELWQNPEVLDIFKQ